MHNAVIYKITNLINSKCYIGQSINYSARIREHIKRHDRKSVISLAIKKYGVDNFKFELICNDLNSSYLNDLEIYFISKYESSTKINGYNVAGGGQFNTRLSTKSKELISNKLKGRQSPNKGNKYSPELIEEMRERSLGDKNHFYGKKHSEESLEKMRSIKTGKTASPETKLKMRNKRIQPIYCNELQVVFFSTRDAATFLGIKCSGNITLHLKNKRHKVKGFTFSYYDK